MKKITLEILVHIGVTSILNSLEYHFVLNGAESDAAGKLTAPPVMMI